MSDPQRVVTRDQVRVTARLREVKVARAQLSAARHKPERACDKPALRAELLTSLEGYAAAIVLLGVPVPRKLKTEIDLYRALRHRA